MVVFCAVSGIIIVTNFKQLFENVKKLMYNYASTSKLWDIKFDICCFMQERLCHIFGNAFAQNILYICYLPLRGPYWKKYFPEVSEAGRGKIFTGTRVGVSEEYVRRPPKGLRSFFSCAIEWARSII
jgi:hypothetical protein